MILLRSVPKDRRPFNLVSTVLDDFSLTTAALMQWRHRQIIGSVMLACHPGRRY